MFSTINNGYNQNFQPGRLSLGLVVPLEPYPNGPIPTMAHHLQRAQLAEQLGFSALWLRDVPFNVPSFGDVGQIYDPFVYLGVLAATTQRIALGVASIILPLRHPAHVAKAAASVDRLSGGRLILGVASGDRPEEYPALNHSFEDRGERFRDSFEYIERMGETFPRFDNPHGALNGGIDMLPKPQSGRLPLLITGGSQQTPEWIAEHGDGWITYPRDVALQARVIGGWRARVEAAGCAIQPALQSLYIDLVEDAQAPPTPIHLGYRLGVYALCDHLKALEEIGINHVALNLRFNRADIETTMRRLADEVLPDFSNAER